LELRPAALDFDLGAVGFHSAGAEAAIELRAFAPLGGGVWTEDPVTGSLNASLAQWLLSTGRARAPYATRQGTILGRQGRVRIEVDDEGQVWTGGGTITCIGGGVEFD
jgi:PhzF family phenazine biosynthesis protein